MVYGSGRYKYELVDNWAKLPKGWSFVDVGGLTIDSQDRIYVFNRSPHPVIILNREGKFLKSWGEGIFVRPHASRFDKNGVLYCADEGNHVIYKFTPEGKLLGVIGEKGKPSNTGYVRKDNLMDSLRTIRFGPPFNRPTGVDFDKSGNFYVTDGYGNARVHKFSPEGKLIKSWGEGGTGPGQFMLPHNIWCDKYEHLWVPDRENNRIQIFDTEGKLLQIWYDVFRPTDVFIDKNDIVYVSEIRPGVSVFNMEGKLLARWFNEEKDPATDLFISCHAITVDSKGDIYIGEVSWTHSKYDKGGKTIQKFARVR